MDIVRGAANIIKLFYAKRRCDSLNLGGKFSEFSL